MTDEREPNGSRSAATLLSEIQRFLEQEQWLFGDTLLIDDCPRKEAPMPARKPASVEEPTLFGPEMTPKPPLTREPWGAARSIAELNEQICTCVKCPLGRTRTKFVFGVGNPQATLLLVGEAPGVEEDVQGEPFVGRAGQLLNKILEAIHFKREEVYICNILKCRPPENRKPAPEEIEECLPYLKKQIELIKPKLILCLGLTAAENLLRTTEGLAKLRGRVLEYEGIPLMVTYHPAALLRNSNWKRPAWEDVQAARKYHDELVAQAANMRA